MPIDIEGLVRTSAKTLGLYKFHQSHRREARRILRLLETRHGKADPANLRLAETYARDVFGNLLYAPWLRVYTAFNGTFKEGWIPDNFYGSVVVPNMKGWYGKISGLKTISRLLFDSDAFPDVAYFANGLFFTRDNVAIPDHEVGNVVFRDCERIVFKQDGSKQGKGVMVLDRATFNASAIRALGNGVMQKFIIQHPVFSQFAAKSVATLRFTTVVDDHGGISVRACFLRLGRVDDTHVQADRDVSVPIDLSTGTLRRAGYLNDWLAIDAHPDSHVKFSGVQIPAFSACVLKVLELHRKIPFARCVGWDLTVDIDGNVQVMEWNGEHNDVKFSEATQGPCFSDLNWEQLRVAI